MTCSRYGSGFDRAAELAFLGLAWLGLCACGQRDQRPGQPPRHVLLVTVAGLRADHVSACSYWRATTGAAQDSQPRSGEESFAIDSLAELGVLFPQAYTPSTSTHAALAALHYGRAPQEVGVQEDGDPPLSSFTPLARSFAQAGFETLARVTLGETPLGDEWKQAFGDYQDTPQDSETCASLAGALEQRDLNAGDPQFIWLHLEDARRVAQESEGDVDAYDAALVRTREQLQAVLSGLAQRAPFEDWLIAFAGLGGASLASDRDVVNRQAHALAPSPLRVPLFLRHRGSLTGRRIFSRVIFLQDLAPTLREWLDLGEHAIPAPGAGHSLLSLTDEWRERSFPTRLAPPRPPRPPRPTGPPAAQEPR